VKALIALALMLAVLGVAGCGGDDDDESDGAATATAADTAGSATGGEDTGGAADGAAVFASAGCGNCHTLSAANASGNVGPNLDELMPDEATVEAQVKSGGGGMPAFEGQLSEEEIQAVSEFVASSAGG
jgi:mono/diheme cytochrome c family protein